MPASSVLPSATKPAASIAADDDSIYNSSVSSPSPYKSSVDNLTMSSDDDALAEMIASKRQRIEQTAVMKVSPPTLSRLALP